MAGGAGDDRYRGDRAVALPAPTPGGDPWYRLLARLLVAERERWPLWLPTSFGAGAAIYLTLPLEPTVAGLAVAGVIFMASAFSVVRLVPLALPTVVLAACLIAGFLAMSMRTHFVAEPVIERETMLRGLTGRVVSVEPFADGPRVTMSHLSLAGRTGDFVPTTVRIRLRAGERVQPGDWISVNARVRPPPKPAYPGAYDFARAAWFRGLGGVGFSLSKVTVVEPPRPASLSEALSGSIDRVRFRLAETLLETANANLWSNAATGGVAAALITGDRSAVPEVVREDMRISGLAHLLAISGLHIGLVAGAVFVLVRASLAAVPSIALRYPIKKWAAVAAAVAAFGYLLLSGGTVPTQRAFIMTGLVMLAVLIDRRAISMRLVAFAAAIVLILGPEQVLSAGFQMSFAAVAALVALFEAYNPNSDGVFSQDGTLGGVGGFPRQVLMYLAVVLLTTVVATAATAPFALYHFGRIANYGLVANLIAVPIMAFWVMPMGLIAVLLTPLHMGFWPTVAMGWGIEAILAIAAEVASWPNSATEVGALPDWGLMLAVFGGIWLVIWRRRWRYLGAPFVIVCVFSSSAITPPTTIVSETGRLMAVSWDGGLWFSSTRREKFVANVWSERSGLPIKGSWVQLASLANSPIRCDGLGCVFRYQGSSIAFSNGTRSLPEDCGKSDIVISTDRRPLNLCASKSFVGPYERKSNGAHTVRLVDGRHEIESVTDRRGNRPWTMPGSLDR